SERGCPLLVRVKGCCRRQVDGAAGIEERAQLARQERPTGRDETDGPRVPARIPGVLASAPAWIALAIWYGRFGTRARGRDPDPRNGCVDGCLVVLTMNGEWIATDAGDLPVVKVQASGDISPSKVMQPCAASSSECVGRCLRPRGDGEGPPG